MGRLITSPTICYGTLLSLFLVLGDVQGNDIDENKEGTGGTVRSEYIIQLMFVGIVVGAFNTHVLTRVSLQIPYTVLLFVQGMLLALLMKKVPMGTFGIAADVWGDVDPELLLFIFLPVLIFGEAMTLNWYEMLFDDKVCLRLLFLLFPCSCCIVSGSVHIYIVCRIHIHPSYVQPASCFFRSAK